MGLGAGLARLVFAMGLTAAVASSACAAPEDDDADSTESAVTNAAAPADPRATAATQTVLANLHSFDFRSVDPFDHRVLVGQQEPDVSNRSTNGMSVIAAGSDMERVTGKSPGLVSYELSHAYKGALTMFDATAFRAGRNAVRELVINQHRKGALVSLVWHMRCPKTAVTENDKFAPGECPRDYTLEELLARKGNGQPGAHFTEWRAMLDELADLLWSLKDDLGELIPVQIRPFHEFTGDWFWWGQRNDPSTYAAAWREMVTYLRDGRGLHNVLWVFCPASPSGSRSFEPYYPGDAYVDVVSFDNYDFGNGRFARNFENDLRRIGSFSRSHGKVAAVAEVGRDLEKYSVDPNWFTQTLLGSLKSTNTKFAYVALWRNAPWEKFVPEPGDGAAATDLTRMANDGATLFAGQHNLYLPLHVDPGT